MYTYAYIYLHISTHMHLDPPPPPPPPKKRRLSCSSQTSPFKYIDARGGKGSVGGWRVRWEAGERGGGRRNSCAGDYDGSLNTSV